jgi:hypothetical protein
MARCSRIIHESLVLSASKTEFEYRHGPIQQALQAALRRILPETLSVVFTNRLDLAIVDGDNFVAIFEVKIGRGSQLYAGIGQLHVYRYLFSNPACPLFLVFPWDAREAKDYAEIGKMLRARTMTVSPFDIDAASSLLPGDRPPHEVNFKPDNVSVSHLIRAIRGRRLAACSGMKPEASPLG